jgi:hypothetical protein
MSARVVVGAVAMCLLTVGAAYAGSPCDGASVQEYRECVRLVDSLRPDKAGQARVFAVDGSEFTPGQAQWMRGQLRKVERLCASAAPADQAEAERLLAEVRGLLVSRHRGS